MKKRKLIGLITVMPESIHVKRVLAGVFKQCEKYGYSARVIHKLLRMARTAADVRGSSRIGREDIIKVLSCRELDKSNSQMYTV